MTYSENLNTASWTSKSVDPFMKKLQRKIERWCDRTLGYENYCSDGYCYSFKFKEHATMFALRWL
jgi:hypothetical protein